MFTVENIVNNMRRTFSSEQLRSIAAGADKQASKEATWLLDSVGGNLACALLDDGLDCANYITSYHLGSSTTTKSKKLLLL